MRRSSGGVPRILDVCLIISKVEDIGVDIRRQVIYRLIITEKSWYNEHSEVFPVVLVMAGTDLISEQKF